MGGDQQAQGQFGNPQMQNLPYDGPMPKPPTASDSYSQAYFDKRDKEREKQAMRLHDALSRLGFVPEAWPREMPMIPYRPSEPQIGF